MSTLLIPSKHLNILPSFISNGITNATRDISLFFLCIVTAALSSLSLPRILIAFFETKLPLPRFLLINPSCSSSSSALIAVIRLTPYSLVILSSVTNGASYSKSPDFIRSFNLSIICLYNGFLSDINVIPPRTIYLNSFSFLYLIYHFSSDLSNNISIKTNNLFLSRFTI